MKKIAILIETQNGQVKKTNLGVIAAARSEGHELYAFLLDGRGFDHKASLEAYGIHKVVDITSGAGPLAWNPVIWSKAVIRAMEHFGISTLLGLTSARGKDLLPRIAARLDAPLVMDCIAVNLDEHSVKKSQYSGKTVAVIKVRGSNFIFGIRPNVIAPKPDAVAAQVISFATDPASKRLEVKEVRQTRDSGIDLTEADVIISGGRGMENSENFNLLRECAAQLGAAVGASRVAVDAGWVPHAMQVGQTGATVSPKVYIACGISGSVQHFAGMKTSRMIIAINTDREAAIVKRCDYFAVADLFDIVPLLTSRLKAEQG